MRYHATLIFISIHNVIYSEIYMIISLVLGFEY